jgi:excisionase family DNA binding protein
MSSVSNSQLPGSVAPAQREFNFDLPPQPLPGHEPLLTIAEACGLFNLKPHVLRRAIKARSIPSYRLGNGRIRLRASDISAAIEASRSGGAK